MKLEEIIEKDPFKKNQLADYELTEFLPTKTCEELKFLMEWVQAEIILQLLFYEKNPAYFKI